MNGQNRRRWLDGNPPQVLVVDLHVSDPASCGEYLGLRSDGHRGKDPSHWMETGVVGQPVQVSGQLLHTVQFTPPFDLHHHGVPGRRPAQQVDRSDVGGILTPDQSEAFFENVGLRGEQLLQVAFDTVLLQTRVGAQLEPLIRERLLDTDVEFLPLGVGHQPAVLLLDEGVGSVHPVERFVGAPIGVDGHTSVGLDHD